MFAGVRRLIDRATRMVPFHRRASYAFLTPKHQAAKRERPSPGRLSELVRAGAVLEVVEASQLIREVDPFPTRPAGGPWVEGFQIRAAGGLGTIWIPCGSDCELKDDLLGSSLDVTGSDGSAFKAFCWSTSGYNEGVVVGFVFIPTPSPTIASISISLQPFSVVQGPSRTVTLEATLA